MKDMWKSEKQIEQEKNEHIKNLEKTLQKSYSEQEVLVLLHKRDAYNLEHNTKPLNEWETPAEWLINNNGRTKNTI